MGRSIRLNGRTIPIKASLGVATPTCTRTCSSAWSCFPAAAT
ncbi:MAG TPA: hypothetical protein VFQ49_11640 [Actinomycetes bacterium]|nr:hypothetical protein [Actinomycetes bacterium]